MTNLLNNKCKCSSGTCYEPFKLDQVQAFLDTFEERSKRDQDTILALALGAESGGKSGRREFNFLGHHLKRGCFESLLGISSHRVDRAGAVDLRYGPSMRPSQYTASIDSFCLVLYNSVAEPLPDRRPDNQ